MVDISFMLFGLIFALRKSTNVRWKTNQIQKTTAISQNAENVELIMLLFVEDATCAMGYDTKCDENVDSKRTEGKYLNKKTSHRKLLGLMATIPFQLLPADFGIFDH